MWFPNPGQYDQPNVGQYFNESKMCGEACFKHFSILTKEKNVSCRH